MASATAAAVSVAAVPDAVPPRGGDGAGADDTMFATQLLLFLLHFYLSYLLSMADG